MYRSLDKLLAGLYRMTAPGGAMYQAAAAFFAEHEVNFDGINSGQWVFSWLKGSPRAVTPVQRQMPGFGPLLVLPTYDDLLTQRLTTVIAHECEQL